MNKKNKKVKELSGDIIIEYSFIRSVCSSPVMFEILIPENGIKGYRFNPKGSYYEVNNSIVISGLRWRISLMHELFEWLASNLHFRFHRVNESGDYFILSHHEMDQLTTLLTEAFSEIEAIIVARFKENCRGILIGGITKLLEEELKKGVADKRRMLRYIDGNGGKYDI